jgi:hypothetical protein
MTVKTYAVLEDCIDRGLQLGIRHVFKHDGSPRNEDQLLEHTERILNDIMNAVCEYFDFEEHGDQG